MIKVNPQEIELIVGLGNPGKKYEKTYHNVGFLALDFLDKKLASLRLLKSDTYMNQSGFFVAGALKKYGIKPEKLLIIHDDSDLALGKYKLCFGRGSAGHNGVESIIKSLNTKNFWRLRIGIRKSLKKKAGLPAEARRAKAGEMVLKKITKTDMEILSETFKEISENI